MNQPAQYSPEEMALLQANNEKHGRMLPRPLYFRPGPVGEDGKALDPARALIAVYPDGTFETTGMPPITGTVCGSIFPPDPKLYPAYVPPAAPPARPAPAPALKGKAAEVDSRALELWLDSRIGKAAQARPIWKGAQAEWEALSEYAQKPFLQAARKSLKTIKETI